MSVSGAIAVPHPPLIMPEVGRGDEHGIDRTIAAYKEAAKFVADLKPDTLIVTTPHSVMYGDYFHISPGTSAQGNFGRFRAPQLKLGCSYDTEFVSALEALCEKLDIPAGPLGEKDPDLDHATMIPLRFIAECLEDVKVVRIGLSGLSFTEHYALGKAIKETADKLNRSVVIVASGDLSHKLKADGPYGFAPEGPVFDQKICEIFRDGDFLSLLQLSPGLCEAAAECGHRSFVIMAGALDQKKVESSLLSYEGPFGVGYAVATFKITGDDQNRDFDNQFVNIRAAGLKEARANEDPYVRLARYSLEHYVKTGRPAPLPSDLLPELKETRAGAFVSLHAFGRLRGCIGTILPVQENLGAEIIHNAVSACSRDPRFPPVRENELETIEYSVDVLTAPEDIDSPDMLDPKIYGAIVSCGSRRGLLLPDLEGVDTVEQQLAICRQKGRIGPEEKVTLQRFKVIRHH